MLLPENICYNVSVPSVYEKKEAGIGTRIPESVKRRIEEIAVSEERKVADVIRLLLLRGLALYEQDGRMRDDQKPDRKLAPVVARIGRDEMSKQEIQRSLDKSETIKVPVRKKVSG
jgi:hypothetical protein